MKKLSGLKCHRTSLQICDILQKCIVCRWASTRTCFVALKRDGNKNDQQQINGWIYCVGAADGGKILEKHSHEKGLNRTEYKVGTG